MKFSKKQLVIVVLLLKEHSRGNRSRYRMTKVDSKKVIVADQHCLVTQPQQK